MSLHPAILLAIFVSWLGCSVGPDESDGGEPGPGERGRAERGHAEQSHADDYAFLRATASAWQSAPLEEGSLFVRDGSSGRCAAGVVVDEARRVWILLNHASDVLRVPDEAVSLSRADLERVSGFCEPSAAVLESLERADEGA